jgi:cell wall-associated NlpC family hydrolase
MPTAQLSANGKTAIPPASAPQEVKDAIYAANRIVGKPYRYGGGHRRFNDSGYDCSGSVSFALRGGNLLKRPLHSRAFMRWGEAGKGQWITVYTNPGHAYVVIAGLRFDTSGPGPRGPRWRKAARSARAFTARHPSGF